MIRPVHLNLGSNIGDSRSILERAVAAVFRLHEGKGAPRRSSVVESEPLGFNSENRFLNTGVEIETSLAPEELLMRLQEIERSSAPEGNIHRNPDGSYRDRYLDIDIIFFGELTIETPWLSIPHPRWRERPFVTGPVRELKTFSKLLDSDL